MHGNARTSVRTFSDDFLVQVGLHKGSVLLSPLLLGLEAISRKICSGCQLYADDLALVLQK